MSKVNEATLATVSNQGLPERSEAQISKSLTPGAVEVTKKFGWDFFKAGVLVVDEYQPRIGDNDPEMKYLLVREAKVKERQPDGSKKWVLSDKGKWNIPCGRLQEWETFEHAALREGSEETGYALKLGQLCHIGHRFDIDNPYVIYIYSATLGRFWGKPDPEEIAETRWFTYDKILELQAEKMLRNADLTLGTIEQYLKHEKVPKNLLVTYKSKYACTEGEN